ncbi:aldo/keto reductase [Emcibacter nanhaiensis]|uniref:Aldo/keto reductase n=1 Tax=Emcibacter nanhaiensis TaxID=1505037 RepID=A0A501PMM0_9PROT|nr:aldo/keto reductase [Emcibacter nanhaiensis]TPD61693.1 aldo/keto reductase [Emcibacter nanhaiensis]
MTDITRKQFIKLTGAAGLALAGGVGAPALADTFLHKMVRKPIPSSGELLPVVGFGTSRVFDVGRSAEERAPLLDTLKILYDAGGSLIDTAPMYGPAEAVVGDLVARLNSRNKSFIATKVLQNGKQAGIDQMNASFHKLKTSHVDLMQVHNLVDWQTQLGTLREMKQDKKIRYLGITHYTDNGTRELVEIMKQEQLDFVQCQYAMNARLAEEELLPLARERGIAILCNRPFGRGALFNKVKGRELPVWAADLGIHSWAQYFLKYLLGHPAVTAVIPGTGRPDHARDNVMAGMSPLPDEAARKMMLDHLHGL